MKILYMLFLCVPLWAQSATSSTEIITMPHTDFKGEQATLKGIVKAFTESMPTSTWHVQEKGQSEKSYVIKADDIAALNSGGGRQIIVAAGKSGAAFARQLIDAPAGVQRLFIHSSHQLEGYHGDLIKYADIVALPAHTVNAEQLRGLEGHKAQIVLTRGVAHETSGESLARAYESNASKLPSVDKPIVLMLGGDAPDSTGRMRYYTQGDVAHTIRTILTFRGTTNRPILLFDGFRTGRHDVSKDPANPVVLDPQPHTRIDGTETYRTAPITDSAIEQLQAAGLVLGESLFRYDFQVGKPSLWDAAQGLALAKEGTIIVPGESTSMITQAYDVAPEGMVLTYEHGAMNEGHKAYIQNDSRIKVLQEDGTNTSWYDPRVGQRAPTESAALTIAKAIKAKLEPCATRVL